MIVDTKTSNQCFKHVIILVVTQVLQDRIDGISKTVQDLEGKNQSLQLTVDRLSLSLAKSEEEESSQKVICTPEQCHHVVVLSLMYDVIGTVDIGL